MEQKYGAQGQCFMLGGCLRAMLGYLTDCTKALSTEKLGNAGHRKTDKDCSRGGHYEAYCILGCDLI
jgi:hypothetical protein